MPGLLHSGASDRAAVASHLTQIVAARRDGKDRAGKPTNGAITPEDEFVSEQPPANGQNGADDAVPVSVGKSDTTKTPEPTPELLRRDAGNVEGQHVAMERSGAESIKADRVTMDSSGAQSMTTRSAQLEKSGVVQLHAERAVFHDSGAVIVQGEEVRLVNSRAFVIGSGKIESEGNVRAGVIGTGHIASQGPVSGLVVSAGTIEAAGGIKATFTPPAAAAFGAAFAVTLLLLGRLLRRIF